MQTQKKQELLLARWKKSDDKGKEITNAAARCDTKLKMTSFQYGNQDKAT